MSQYTTGYSIGVGGVVYHDEKVLFVRGIEKTGPGFWQLPGGFVEKNETIEDAIVREVREEAGIEANVIGIVGARHRLFVDSNLNSVDENSIYLVFKLRPKADAAGPKADGIETDIARFLSYDEIESLTPCATIFKVLALKVIKDEIILMQPHEIVGINGNKYQIYY